MSRILAAAVVAAVMAWAFGAAGAQAPNIPAPGTTLQDCEECPEMVAIPAGTFIMGQPADARIGRTNTQHSVTIPAFEACKYHVNVTEWYY